VSVRSVTAAQTAAASKGKNAQIRETGMVPPLPRGLLPSGREQARRQRPPHAHCPGGAELLAAEAADARAPVDGRTAAAHADRVRRAHRRAAAAAGAGIRAAGGSG